MPVEVEVELYSGRPNPRFLLPQHAAAELRQRLARLPLAGPGAPTLRDGLGYRGVRIQGEAAPGTVEVIVSAGSVELRDAAGGLARRTDPGRDLERWLIEVAAAGRIDPDELDAARQDLDR